MKTTLLFLAAILVAGFATAIPATAQTDLRSDRGYVDLSQFETLIDSEVTLEVNLSGAFLRMVTEAAAVEDDDLARLLGNLRGIFVRGYSLDSRGAMEVRDGVSTLARRLRDNGWERIVRVRDDGEQVDVMVRSASDRIEGLTVFVVNAGSNETVFVNIVGTIRPEEIGRIGRRFRIGALEDL